MREGIDWLLSSHLVSRVEISLIGVCYQQLAFLLLLSTHIPAKGNLPKYRLPEVIYSRSTKSLLPFSSFEIKLYFPTPPLIPIILPKTPFFSRTFFTGPRGPPNTIFMYAI